ncbi:Zinc finger swim domain-containing protein 3 [Plakobranchus ocellatus]|uniref:Zinc finger swim domain-containing protein 3 n=1 Tax=Plakobranchus ocellatus TaxID=259542 RepID=A0AAV3YP29_9GAST|nr:Zinc finger swim domain-containing protein 3 [Plakobranchus ocellatus]
MRTWDQHKHWNVRSELYSEKWFVDSGGRTIEQANSKIANPTLHYKKEFKYAFVNFKCIHGGIFKSRGSKRNRQSHQLECPAKITLSAQRKTDKLVITKLNLEHNHEHIPESCAYYHADRRVTEKEKNEITKLVKLGLTAGKIMNHMSETSGTVFCRHDIHNVAKQGAKPSGTVQEEVWSILTKMCKEDSTSQYFIRGDSENNMSTLFFQTGAMRRILNVYCDVLFVDGTYCLNNLGYPLYVFLCVDGEIKGRVVGYCIVKDETTTTLTDVFQDFISSNHINVKTVVVDKDAAEIAAIKEVFPEVNILLCSFHVAQSFKTAATKYCPPSEREKSLDILMKMLYATSEEDFVTSFEMLPSWLKIYIEKNWMPNRKSWAQYMTKHILSWGTKTNNHVERHNRVLKTLSSHTKSLPSLIEKILDHHRNEEQRLALTATTLF